MAITFPLDVPSTIKPDSVKWSLSSAIGISQSPTTFQTTKYEFDGESWIVDVSYPLLTREEAAPFFAFLAALRGRNGTFLFGDTLLRESLGSPGGTPLVNGANQTGSKTLITDGWTPSTLVLKAGDFIQVDTALYMVLADVTSSSGGEATIDIFPRARTHADNTVVIFEDARGLFRLISEDQVVVEAGSTQFFNISFQAAEAL